MYLCAEAIQSEQRQTGQDRRRAKSISTGREVHYNTAAAERDESEREGLSGCTWKRAESLETYMTAAERTLEVLS